MFQAQLGLWQRPFPATPDLSCYYPATTHERAVARLRRGLDDGAGILLLTGPAGTGKTLLAHCLLERADADLATAFLAGGHFPDRSALLQATLFDLSLPYRGLSEQEMRLALTDHLLKSFGEGRRTVLVLDEAHHLGADLLEELRLWGNLEARAGKALQVVLLGQPALLETLRLPVLASLRQRLAVRADLEPLGPTEAVDYLFHHLRRAGGRPEQILGDEAAELLARRTGGVPRLLNQAAHQALSLAAEANVAAIEVEVVLEALSLMGLEEDDLAGSADPAESAGGEGTGIAPVAGPTVSGGGNGSQPADDGSCRLFVSTRDVG
jgi:type II secretory pathway predicted ATPase ExeA